MFGVALGRFSPIHLGHECVINTMRRMCESLVVIGSSNVPMSMRNFFSYEERRNFIKMIYKVPPGSTVREQSIIGLPDYEDDKKWLLALDDLVCAVMNCTHEFAQQEVVFFGGSAEDLRFFIDDGRKVHIVNRFDGVKSPKISASEIRDDLLYGRTIKGKVNDLIIPEITSTFNKNWELFKRI